MKRSANSVGRALCRRRREPEGGVFLTRIRAVRRGKRTAFYIAKMHSGLRRHAKSRGLVTSHRGDRGRKTNYFL